MSDYFVSGEILSATAYSKRWSVLAKTGTDLPTLKTWDPTLPRDRRVLVPVDVQAFVATADGERVTRVGGVLDDPEPFADLAALPKGVHLHWALPDSLLAGRAEEGSERPDFPRLPDRWVVVRTLARTGQSTVLHRGWVVDARTGGIAPLETYAGGSIPGDGESLDPLDATSRRSLLWTSTYAGAQGRFTLHDDLADVITERGSGAPLAQRACYLVAGWYSEDGFDPLSGVGILRTLEAVTAGLGWIVTRDGPDSDEEDVDPATKRAESRMGKKAPTGGEVSTVTSTGTQVLRHEGLAPSGMVQLDRVTSTILGRRSPAYRTLLHGAVIGVPVDQTATGSDHRPHEGSVTGAIGLDLDDVAAALAGSALSSSVSARRGTERLMAAFTSGLLPRLGSADGLFDLDEHEHTDTFSSVPGPPLPGAKPDRLRAEDSLAANPLTVGRKGRSAQPQGARKPPKVTFSRRGVKGLRESSRQGESARQEREGWGKSATGGIRRTTDEPPTREVIKAAPRIFRPAAPLIGLRGTRPSSRHHHDRSHDASGRLFCRRPGDVVTALTGIVEGQRVLPTLGSGAVPTEVLALAREMVLLNGYDATWLAAVGAERVSTAKELKVRLGGELLRLYGTSATYDGTGIAALAEETVTRGGPRATASSWDRYRARKEPMRAQLASAVSAHSLLDGMAPSPVALTAWAQPWCPLFVEWEVRLEGRDDLEGWTLGAIDLEPTSSTSPAAPGVTVTRSLRGRSPLSLAVGTTLVAAIRAWLTEEQKRDEQPGASQLSDADEKVLAGLADVLAPLSVVSASLDGIREQLLGIAYSGFVVREKSAAGEDALPEADDLPVPVFGGTLEVTALRLVDTFGRVLPLDVSDLPTTSRLEVPGSPSAVRVAPRLQHGARWLFRLVDPAHPIASDPHTATEAWVDQVRPALSVNPVSGFLLPDHIDEACEVFDRDGHPLGQIDHDAVTGAVMWEPAPGRPVPPSAGPLDPTTPAHAQLAGRIAAGLVQADIDARTSAGKGTELPHTALSAFLGVIDSTLWSVDTYAALGSPSIAGLVGRPLAIVRATLRLDAPDDLGEIRVSAPGGPAARLAAFESMRRHRFPVRLGDLGRSDDATIGFFVDDDYSRFHVVDKVVAQVARESRPHHGHLGLLGATVTPAVSPIEHPYIHAEDTLLVSIGQIVRLTIVMVPGGQVHLTSGIAPRKGLGLADEWVTPGLNRISPSMRVGPLLVDPAEIKLPMVASLGPDQVFTRRTGPLTWRDDPIVAATAAAYLPRMPHEAQEGWIRVTPDLSDEDG